MPLHLSRGEITQLRSLEISVRSLKKLTVALECHLAISVAGGALLRELSGCAIVTHRRCCPNVWPWDQKINTKTNRECNIHEKLSRRRHWWAVCYHDNSNPNELNVSQQSKKSNSVSLSYQWLAHRYLDSVKPYLHSAATQHRLVK